MKTVQRTPDRRSYERYHLHSTMRIKINGMIFEGELKTIGEGGVSFHTERHVVTNDDVINVLIVSPDGKEIIDVMGKIVWNKGNTYGLMFLKLNDLLRHQIRNWCKNLFKLTKLAR